MKFVGSIVFLLLITAAVSFGAYGIGYLMSMLLNASSIELSYLVLLSFIFVYIAIFIEPKYSMHGNWICPDCLEAGEIIEETARNNPCPCGSGKKYKKCCGKNNSSSGQI